MMFFLAASLKAGAQSQSLAEERNTKFVSASNTPSLPLPPPFPSSFPSSQDFVPLAPHPHVDSERG